MLKALCVQCKKLGIKKEIEMEQVDTTGRTVIRRSCGIHGVKSKKK